MPAGGGRCAFCGATAGLVTLGVLDDKWSRRFGGDPVVALDHGWYTGVSGERRPVERLDPSKFFSAHVRAVCDFCAHGWVEDVRWRAEPTLLALAQGRGPNDAQELPALARWARLTAMLAELVEGMPQAASAGQRDAVRRGGAVDPEVGSWFFALRQRLPARVHLSQVAVGASLVQIVSVDLARFSTLVVLPSDEQALRVVEHADVPGALGVDTSTVVSPLDLSRTRHPHAVAVQRLCAAGEALAG